MNYCVLVGPLKQWGRRHTMLNFLIQHKFKLDDIFSGLVMEIIEFNTNKAIHYIVV